MRMGRGWPRLALIALMCAALGAAVATFWVRRENKNDEAAVMGAARVERVEGTVGLDRMLEDAGLDDQWSEVTQNTPVSVGDRLYVGADSRASVAFTGRNFARLDPDTSLDVLAYTDDRTQLALRDGAAVFEIGELDDGEFYEIATPHGAFELREPGFYEVGMNEDGGAWLSVLSGVARFVSLAGSGDVGRGEMLTLLGQTAADVVLSRLSPDYAGSLVNDYYADQYPGVYDGRYNNYDAYLADPYYFDPYNRYDSYRYVSDSIPGVRDLDRYGDWREMDGYGYVWQPKTDAGWTPYQQGYWTLDDPHGLTWVSTEPWGYAPYHYGRWANVGGQWYWVPEGTDASPAYAPALVAFLPPDSSGLVGWVPLAPGDTYVRTYYGPDWQPHYQDDVDPSRLRIANLDVQGAMTAVRPADFWRVLDRQTIAADDARTPDRSRAVLDPLSVGELRQIALLESKARRGAKLPPGLSRKWAGVDVLTATQPAANLFGRNVARALGVKAVPEKQKKQKLQLAEDRREKPSEAAGQRGRNRRATAPAEAPGLAAETPAQPGRSEERGRRPEGRPEVDAPRGAGRPDRAGADREGNAAQRPQGERIGGRGNAQRAEEGEQAAPRGAAVKPQPQRRMEAPRAEPPRPQNRPGPQARPQQQAPGQQKADRQQKPPAGKGGDSQGKGQGGGGGKGKGRP